MSNGATPLMNQYLTIKAAHADALLLFRMGDFYELFFDDAEKAARALDIVLTRRGKHEDVDIPMCGVPVHALEGYLARLVKQGFRVAICEQTEDPAEARKRGHKAVVKRDVVRIITPGTLTEDSLIGGRSANRILGLALDGETLAVAWADVSTGEFACQSGIASNSLERAFALDPREVLISQHDADAPGGRALIDQIEGMVGLSVVQVPGPRTDPARAKTRLESLFDIASLDVFGSFVPGELRALSLVADYVRLTQAGNAPQLAPPQRLGDDDALHIDPASWQSLELDRTSRGGRTGALLQAIDQTQTPMGARLLNARLARPLLDIAAIDQRLDLVASLLDRPSLAESLKRTLAGITDLERALQRLSLDRGGPRDLLGLVTGLAAAHDLGAGLVAENLPGEGAKAVNDLAIWPAALAAVVADGRRALVPDAAPHTRDAGFIAPGFDAQLDAARRLRDDAQTLVLQLQATLGAETGLPLKIKHNNMLGYHIEVAARYGEALLAPPHNAHFLHRQTLPQVMRFSTPDIAALDRDIANAADNAFAREKWLFEDLRQRLVAETKSLRAIFAALAILDVALAAALWAQDVQAVRPSLGSHGRFVARGLRHPVIEAALAKKGERFCPNDLTLDADGASAPRLAFVTGPNMAGKSTFLRMAALAQILAQIGFYVPAQSFETGIADRVFSRVGASDDLARGRSTFMVEMIETAAILAQASARSFVILDEIGRGTATFDGLAIAWAVAEHLHDTTRCRALFATHYHELCGLADRLAGAGNLSLSARTWAGKLVFLHQVQIGPADKSYGIDVARQAGLPPSAIKRAQQVLKTLEAGRTAGRAADPLPLFAAFAESDALAEPPPLDPSPIELALATIDPDQLSPRAALQALYRLKAIASGQPEPDDV